MNYLKIFIMLIPGTTALHWFAKDINEPAAIFILVLTFGGGMLCQAWQKK